VQARRFLGGVRVFLRRQPLHEPDIQEIENVISEPITGTGFLVENLVQVLYLLREIRLAPRAVHAVFGDLVKRDPGRGARVVLHPEAQTLGVESELGVQFLEEPHVPFVAPEESVRVELRGHERVRDEGLGEDAIFLVRLAVVRGAAVSRLVADALVIREPDVVRRIGIYHVGLVAVHELRYGVRVERIATDKAMTAERVYIAGPYVGFLDLCEFFLLVEVVIGNFEIVVEDIREVA
jgi:hypothetical protein